MPPVQRGIGSHRYRQLKLTVVHYENSYLLLRLLKIHMQGTGNTNSDHSSLLFQKVLPINIHC